MANRSSFVSPNYVMDNFIEHHNISNSDKPNILRYKFLLEQNSRTIAEDEEFVTLGISLRDKIPSPEDWNLLQDAMTNLETNHQTIYNNYVALFNATLAKYSDQGIWSGLVNYQQWNCVTYLGQTFRSKQDGNLNHIPTGGVGDLFWILEARKGDTGLGLGLSYLGAYNNSNPYLVNNCVSYNGLIYYCTANSTGNLPTNTSYWTIFPIGTVPIVQSIQPSSVSSGQIWIETY